MTLEQIIARLAAISASLEGISAGAEGYTQEQIEQIETLNTEFESLSAQKATAERVAAMKAAAAAPAPRVSAPVAPVARVEVIRDNSDRFGGFKNSAEFLMAVRDFGQNGKVAKQFASAAYEKSGEDGGFLVPEDISTEIVKKLESSDDSLMARTRSVDVSGNAMSFPVDESNPWTGGIQAYWTAEGAPITESKPKFGDVSLRLHKLAALVKTTDELLDDAVALESYIKSGAPEAIMYAVNKSIVSGTGAGKPHGILNSPFVVEQEQEDGQDADTIVSNNIIKMYSRMFPVARAGAVWLINAGAEPQLNTLVDGQGRYLYMGPGGTMNNTPFGLLMGRPVIPMMAAMPALGDAGDILFANLKYYWMIQKAGGVKSAQSIHLLFDREQTAFRFSLRLDGKVPFKTPVTTEFGAYDMSAFVTLEARSGS